MSLSFQSSLSIVLAYIGPGSGLMGIVILLAMLAAVLVALIGFLWNPLKGLLRRTRPSALATDREEDLFEE